MYKRTGYILLAIHANQQLRMTRSQRIVLFLLRMEYFADLLRISSHQTRDVYKTNAAR